MKAIRFIPVLACVFLFELFLSAMFALRAVNLAKYPYRLEERNAASQAYNRERTPEKETAFRQELLLAGRHSLWRQLTWAGVAFSAFLVLDGIVIYRWKHDHERQSLA